MRIDNNFKMTKKIIKWSYVLYFTCWFFDGIKTIFDEIFVKTGYEHSISKKIIWLEIEIFLIFLNFATMKVHNYGW